MTVAELCRQCGIRTMTFYRWKAKYDGMSRSDAQHLKQLTDDNHKLRCRVDALTIENQALKDLLTKNW